MNFFKNRFLFIMLISVATFVLLIVGSFLLYQDHSSVFSGEGYIIETTTKANKKYYFSANTKYKDNVDNKVTFSDKDKKKVAVDPASFVHYMNGDVSFLQKGALVNLSELSNPMVTYYNITDENTIVSENGGFTVSSNGKKINIDSFLGRISDNKYLVAGKDLALKIPKVDERISGDYFEILYIEDGIVKIDNREASYQVTAQDSYIYVGDNITISLGDGKIFYNGEPKMLMSQITINGDENIDLDVEKTKNGGAGGTGSGEGTGSGVDDGTGIGDGTGNGTGDGTGTDVDGNGLANGNGLGNGTGTSTTASPQIELIDADVTSTSIDLSLQLNNASLAKGDIMYYLTNVMTGERVDGERIDLVNGTFKITKESLSPSTEYALSIGELDSEDGRQYFQKIFKTSDLGISLEKNFATDSSLGYKINFSENTDVNMARLVIFDSDGKNEGIKDKSFIISKDDLQNSAVFEELKSNSSYSVSVDMVWINNAAYSNIYSINRIDTTLKKAPTLSGIDIKTNSEEVKFTLQLKDVIDPDKAIVNYVYNIYNADDIKMDNPNPEVVYSVTKTDKDALVLDLNEIAELKSGVDYRAKIIAQYNDNEMIREASTDFSGNFLIKSKPNISFIPVSLSMNKVTGTLSLTDANCSVPLRGRSCLNEANAFTLRYYKMKESEALSKEIADFSFNGNTLNKDVTFDNLSSNTTYAIKLYGNYYDDNNVLHSNVQIGDTLYFTTDKTENLQFEVVKDNQSGKNKAGESDAKTIVTFDAKLSVPQEKREEVIGITSSINLNLYSGRYNTKEKLIGNYKITNKEEIANFFDNYNITNYLFSDVTDNHLGKIDSIAKLVKLTNNVTNTLNSDYTVEVEGVYYSEDTEKFEVEDNVYTFHLTNSYYLDTRIVLDRGNNLNKKYVAVTPITKEQLSDEEYAALAVKIPNLDELNKDTVVGVTLENTLSDIFVDSAYTYEKVVLQYKIHNNATGKDITSEQIPELAIEMGNKYQPKELTIYLDSSSIDDGSHFTRGYLYDIGYTLNFTTEDGSNPVYSNDALSKNVEIKRQDPIYTQYISTSTDHDITYRYTFKDIDNAIVNNNFYYKLKDSDAYSSVANALVADNLQHDVTLPIGDRIHYDFAYARKTTKNETEYVVIHDYDFEKEYSYDNSVSFTIIEDNDNVLKLRLENNDVTDRAVAYRVNIKTQSDDIAEYSQYFLASKLSTLDVLNGEVDEEGNALSDSYKYIAIDYANISRFMKHMMEVSVTAFFDSGLVGIHQDFDHGFIFKNKDKFLNAYINESSSNQVSWTPKVEVSTEALGIYFLKNKFKDNDTTLVLYNHLRGISDYNVFRGTGIDGIKRETVLDIAVTNAGLSYTYGKNTFTGYSPKVLKEVSLKTNKNTSIFNTIIPTVTVNASSTINSIQVNMTARGIYGNSQFVKDGNEHRKVYVTFYSDLEKQHELDTLEADVTITGSDDSGYSATISSVEYKNLDPDTTYYYTLSAYIDGEYRQLYDSIDKTSYVSKTYATKTRGGKDILDKITFRVAPIGYQGESSKKRISWKLNFKDTNNYRVRFELYAPNSVQEDDAVTYKQVSFDGKDAVSCDKLSNGTSSNGYVSNCYINVDMNDIKTIQNVMQNYDFTGDSFVFGDGYYKLVVYAIPFTNDTYVEDKKVVLYQNDALKTDNDGTTYDIKINELSPVTFGIQQEDDNSDNINGKAYVKFKPVIRDDSFVMKYGKYTISLQDAAGDVESCQVSVNDGSVQNLSPCIITLDYEVNTTIKFTGSSIQPNTMYSVNFTYSTYRNNVGYTEEAKVNVVPAKSIIYSPIGYGVVVGDFIPSLVNSKSVDCTYDYSYNLSNTVQEIKYTISLTGGIGSSVSGYYSLREENKNTTQIFTVTSKGSLRFLIDLSDDAVSNDTGFTFRTGNKYLVELQYYNENGDLIGRSSKSFNA